MGLEQWTYIIMMYSLATFPGIDVSRSWLHLTGPYDTQAQCEEARQEDKADKDLSISQCMTMLNARALSEPYNNGAFVLETRKVHAIK